MGVGHARRLSTNVIRPSNGGGWKVPTERNSAKQMFRRWETLQDIVRLQVRHCSQDLSFWCRCQSRGWTLSGGRRRRPGVWPPFDSTRGQWSQRSGVGLSIPQPPPAHRSPARISTSGNSCLPLRLQSTWAHLRRALIGLEMTGVRTISNLTSHGPCPLGASSSCFFASWREAQKHSVFFHQGSTTVFEGSPLFVSLNPASHSHLRLIAQWEPRFLAALAAVLRGMGHPRCHGPWLPPDVMVAAWRAGFLHMSRYASRVFLVVIQPDRLRIPPRLRKHLSRPGSFQSLYSAVYHN